MTTYEQWNKGGGGGGGGMYPHNLQQQEHYSGIHDRSMKRQCGLVG